MENPRYLGDGVYAHFDGCCIVLMANDHRNPTDTICVEPSVLRNLNQFSDEIYHEASAELRRLQKEEGNGNPGTEPENPA
jgi:hypothetical protein